MWRGQHAAIRCGIHSIDRNRRNVNLRECFQFDSDLVHQVRHGAPSSTNPSRTKLNLALQGSTPLVLFEATSESWRCPSKSIAPTASFARSTKTGPRPRRTVPTNHAL